MVDLLQECLNKSLEVFRVTTSSQVGLIVVDGRLELLLVLCFVELQRTKRQMKPLPNLDWKSTH